MMLHKNIDIKILFLLLIFALMQSCHSRECSLSKKDKEILFSIEEKMLNTKDRHVNGIDIQSERSLLLRSPNFSIYHISGIKPVDRSVKAIDFLNHVNSEILNSKVLEGRYLWGMRETRSDADYQSGTYDFDGVFTVCEACSMLRLFLEMGGVDSSAIEFRRK